MSNKYIRLLIVLLQLLMLCSCSNSSDRFADDLIEKFKAESLNSGSIDWNTFNQKVKKSFKVSKEAGIIEALTLNNNRHTYYYLSGKLLKGRYSEVLPEDTCYAMGYFKKKNFRHIGYINIPKFYNTNASERESRQKSISYINEILDSIKAQDQAFISTWVIDLRYNYGGDMWPMLIALSPFFNDGTLGYFKSHQMNERWRKENHKIFLANTAQNDRVFNDAIPYKIKNKHAKIAVLIGKGTQSAGEATAIALKSIKGIKFFGTVSKGLATSNRQINMGNNEFLVLTNGFMLDVNGKKYINGIQPDYKVCNYRELEKMLLNFSL